uniref:24 kDa protein n=1 Tax=Grapevine leafroll-associated virus 2 TaxID=64003 RepID=A0A0F6R448_9CLOS|nr:24 kDa protein [Grapevine leafroll-associated virus 2]
MRVIVSPYEAEDILKRSTDMLRNIDSGVLSTKECIKAFSTITRDLHCAKASYQWGVGTGLYQRNCAEKRLIDTVESNIRLAQPLVREKVAVHFCKDEPKELVAFITRKYVELTGVGVREAVKREMRSLTKTVLNKMSLEMAFYMSPRAWKNAEWLELKFSPVKIFRDLLLDVETLNELCAEDDVHVDKVNENGDENHDLELQDEC